MLLRILASHLTLTAQDSDTWLKHASLLMKMKKIIKSHIVVSCLPSHLRRRALRDDMNLKVLLNYGRGLEMSKKQAKGIEEYEKYRTFKQSKKESHRLKARSVTGVEKINLTKDNLALH